MRILNPWIRWQVLILGVITLAFSMNLSSALMDYQDEITVFAPNSFQSTLEQAKEKYESRHPDVVITLIFGDSCVQTEEIKKGAPADLFISDGARSVSCLLTADLINPEGIKILAHNQLQIILSASTPSFNDLNDLTLERIKTIAIAKPETTPLGKATKEALIHAKLWDKLSEKIVFVADATEVLNVTSLETTDVGIVYASDARSSANQRVALTISAEMHQPVIYPMAILKNASKIQKTERFMSYLQSAEVINLMKRAGFCVP